MSPDYEPWSDPERTEAAYERILGTMANLRSELTDREAAVLRCASHGLRERETAVVLGVALSTVITHRQRACRVLGGKTVAHAVALAIRAGLI